MLSCFLVGHSVLLTSQISFEAYLKKELSSQDSILSIQPNIPEYKAPWVKRWDLRMDTDEFQLQRQQYEIRPNLTSSKVRKYQNALYSNYLSEYQIEVEKARSQEVSLLYRNWLSALFLERRLALDTSAVPLLEDQLRLKQSGDTKGEISVYDILEAQRNLEYFKWDIKESQKRLNTLFDVSEELVSVEKVIAFAESSMLAGKLNYPNFKEDALDLEKLENEFLLEKAKTKQVLDFVRFNYNGPHLDPFEERVSVGVSMNFRRSEKKELGLIERRLDSQMEEVRIFRKQLEYKESLEVAMEKLRLAVDRYINYKGLNERLRVYDEALRAQDPISKSDILKWLDLRLEQLKSEKLMLDYEEEVFSCYLEWLKTSGLLENNPSFNFLDSNLSFTGF